jgi:hypothetical protein
MYEHHPFTALSAFSSRSPGEKYDRLFPELPPLDFDDSAAAAYAADMESVEVDDNPDIAAAYTYFGQFLDHDITFDPNPDVRVKRPAECLVNVRTPRLDLDSLYGSGPVVDPFLYDRSSPGRLLVGKGRDHRKASSPETAEDDLPRNRQGIALLGDPRNDQNVLVSQIHLAFLRFHNRVLDLQKSTGLGPAAAFDAAERTVRWHYQWIVLHDFLPRIVEVDVLGAILPDGSGPARERYRGRYFPINRPRIPVEFAGAAYRFGHSMVRNTYVLNDNFEERLGPRIIFSADGEAGPAPDLRGGRYLPWGWSLQWDRFLTLPGGQAQPSQKIDLKLAKALRQVPGFTPSDLALRNLLRGRSLGLPSGQDVARHMGLLPLGAAKPEPLWRYILREASEFHDGRRLGPVGSRIVAEVVLGIVAGDAAAYVNAEPEWQPSPAYFAPNHNEFDLAGLVYAAGMPCDRVNWRRWVAGTPSAPEQRIGPLPGTMLGTGARAGSTVSLQRGGVI